MGSRIVLADDHPMCREIARMASEAVIAGAQFVEAATLGDALAVDAPVDLVILDLGLPDSRGIASLIDIVRARPSTPILVVTASDEAAMQRMAAAAGAAGFVSKAAPIADLTGAIREILNGGRWFADGIEADDPAATDLPQRLASLTGAESRVLRAMRGGGLNKQIAHELGLSEITVKQHVKAILRKLRVLNRTQAVLALHDAERAATP